MTINQILSEMEKLFDEKFPCINAGCDNNGTIANRVSDDEWEPEQCEYCFRNRLPFKSFIHSYTRKIVESVAEEILDIQLPRLPEDISDRRYSMGLVQGFNATQEKARLKVKEIVNSISK